MGDLLPLLVLAVIGVVMAALVDCVITEDRMIRQLPKAFWIIIILALPVLGAVMWFAGGRADGSMAEAYRASGHPAGRGRRDTQPDDAPLDDPRIEEPAAAGRTASAESTHPRVLAPDDDPEFLAELATRTAKMRQANLEARAAGGTAESGGLSREEERLRRWEADLEEREKRLRQRDEPPTDA